MSVLLAGLGKYITMFLCWHRNLLETSKIDKALLHECRSYPYWFSISYISTMILTFFAIYIRMILTFSVFLDVMSKGYVSLNTLNEAIRVTLGEREQSTVFPKSKTNSTPGVQLRILGWKKEEVSWLGLWDPRQEFQREGHPACALFLLTTLESRVFLIYSSHR